MTMDRIEAIVYESNTGHTKQYAEMVSQKTGIPAYTKKESAERVKKGSTVLFMGWLCAGSVKGLAWAQKTFHLAAVCAVGMALEDKNQTEEIVKRYRLDEMPLFYLQGGFEMEKLSGTYRFMMASMLKLVGSKLEKKPDRTPEEEEILQMMFHGSNKVDEANLKALLDWLDAEKFSFPS